MKEKNDLMRNYTSKSWDEFLTSVPMSREEFGRRVKAASPVESVPEEVVGFAIADNYEELLDLWYGCGAGWYCIQTPFGERLKPERLGSFEELADLSVCVAVCDIVFFTQHHYYDCYFTWWYGDAEEPDETLPLTGGE